MAPRLEEQGEMIIRLIRHNPYNGKREENRIVTGPLPDWIGYPEDALNELATKGWYSSETKSDHRFLLIDISRFERDA